MPFFDRIDRIDRIVRINKNHVNPVNPVQKKAPPQAAKFKAASTKEGEPGSKIVTNLQT